MIFTGWSSPWIIVCSRPITHCQCCHGNGLKRIGRCSRGYSLILRATPRVACVGGASSNVQTKEITGGWLDPEMRLTITQAILNTQLTFDVLGEADSFIAGVEVWGDSEPSVVLLARLAWRYRGSNIQVNTQPKQLVHFLFVVVCMCVCVCVCVYVCVCVRAWAWLTFSSSNLFLWASSTSVLAEGRDSFDGDFISVKLTVFFSGAFRAASFSLAARIEGLQGRGNEYKQTQWWDVLWH